MNLMDKLWTRILLLSNAGLWFCVILFLLSNCNGIGGPSVIPYENFKNQAENYFYLKVIECGRIYSDGRSNDNASQSSRSDDNFLLGILSGVASKSSEILSVAGPSYVTIKDANYCYKSILAVPCGQNYSEFLAAYTLSYSFNCSPEKACITSHQNTFQGNFCNR